MLKEPGCGWVGIMFGTQCLGSASYLTDVPIDCLESMIDYLSDENMTRTFSIEFDAEGYIFGIIEFSDFLYYIHDDTIDGIPSLEKLHPELIGMEPYATAYEIVNYLAQELIGDISSNESAWIYWDCLDDDDESEISERKEKLKDLLIKLKNLI